MRIDVCWRSRSIEECSYQMQATTNWSKSVRVEVGGDDWVGHAGNIIARMLADNLGLSSGFSAALSRPEVPHQRGAVLQNVAMWIAGGAENLAGTAVLRDQERLFRQGVSVPTMWRSLNEIDRQGIAGIALVRNKIRERLWELIEGRHGAIPPSRTCYGDLGPAAVIRIDGSLVESHSDEQHAAGNFKGGYGFHPPLAWCDNTGEVLAVICRLGNAESNTAADHIAIIDRGDRGDPDDVATQPVDHHRRGGLKPRRGRAPEETERQRGPVGNLVGRVRPRRRAGPSRDRAHVRQVGGGGGCGPARPATTRRWPS
jgi:Transposase DDE domain group 1